MAILAYDNNGASIQATGFVSSVDISFNGTSAQSSTFSADTFLLRLVSTEDCRVVTRGTNPVATATSTRLIANTPEYVKVTPGDKLAVIQDTAAGVLNVTVCG